MTYQEIRNQLKALKEQGHVIPALNSKKEVLEAALTAILATPIAATEIAQAETKKPVSAKAAAARKENSKKMAKFNKGYLDFVLVEDAEPEIMEVEEIITPARKELDFTTTNQYPAFLTALATVLAFLQFLSTKSAPYLGKALRYVQTVLIPKLTLASRFMGLVVLLVVLKMVRRSAIA